MNAKKSSYNLLKTVISNQGKTLCIHCSRQNLTDNDGGLGTPRITAIFIKSIDGKISKSFAIHHEAEKVKIIREEIDNYYDLLEERMLEAFNEFVGEYREYDWLHWDMDGVHLGFEAIKHRYCVLIHADAKGFNELPYEKRINLHSQIKSIYLDNYENDPKLDNLIKSNHNGQLLGGYLSTEEEAKAFKDLDFPRILESIGCKVDFFIDSLNKVVEKKLVVSNKNLLYRLEKFITHPIVATITALATLFGTILGIIALF